jgi:hypothetical protein
MRTSAQSRTEVRRLWLWPVAATAVISAVLVCLRWWFGRGKEPVHRYDPPPVAPPDGGIEISPVWDEIATSDPTAPPSVLEPRREGERELQPVG